MGIIRQKYRDLKARAEDRLGRRSDSMSKDSMYRPMKGIFRRGGGAVDTTKQAEKRPEVKKEPLPNTPGRKDILLESKVFYICGHNPESVVLWKKGDEYVVHYKQNVEPPYFVVGGYYLNRKSAEDDYKDRVKKMTVDEKNWPGERWTKEASVPLRSSREMRRGEAERLAQQEGWLGGKGSERAAQGPQGDIEDTIRESVFGEMEAQGMYKAVAEKLHAANKHTEARTVEKIILDEYRHERFFRDFMDSHSIPRIPPISERESDIEENYQAAVRKDLYTLLLEAMDDETKDGRKYANLGVAVQKKYTIREGDTITLISQDEGSHHNKFRDIAESLSPGKSRAGAGADTARNIKGREAVLILKPSEFTSNTLKDLIEETEAEVEYDNISNLLYVKPSQIEEVIDYLAEEMSPRGFLEVDSDGTTAENASELMSDLVDIGYEPQDAIKFVQEIFGLRTAENLWKEMTTDVRRGAGAAASFRYGEGPVLTSTEDLANDFYENHLKPLRGSRTLSVHSKMYELFNYADNHNLTDQQIMDIAKVVSEKHSERALYQALEASRRAGASGDWRRGGGAGSAGSFRSKY